MSIELAPLEGILLLGPPGVGKGTQVKELVKNNNYFFVLPTGEWLRELKDQEESYGVAIKIKEILTSGSVNKGNLIPDDLMIPFVYDKLRSLYFSKQAKSNPNAMYSPFQDLILLDGFPRTVRQAQMTARINPGLVLFLNASEQAINGRIDHRRNTEHRLDDEPEAVARRKQVYEQDTKPLVEYYFNRPGTTFVNIDSSESLGVAKIHQNIAQVISSYYGIDVK